MSFREELEDDESMLDELEEYPMLDSDESVDRLELEDEVTELEDELVFTSVEEDDIDSSLKSRIGTEAQVINALVIGCPVLINISPSPLQ